jgi:hypothetical protein
VCRLSFRYTQPLSKQLPLLLAEWPFGQLIAELSFLDCRGYLTTAPQVVQICSPQVGHSTVLPEQVLFNMCLLQRWTSRGLLAD